VHAKGEDLANVALSFLPRDRFSDPGHCPYLSGAFLNSRHPERKAEALMRSTCDASLRRPFRIARWYGGGPYAPSHTAGASGDVLEMAAVPASVSRSGTVAKAGLP
jgi:hypothetical protein